MEQRIAELERRLARAEVEVRILRGVGLVVLVVASILLKYHDSSTIRAPFKVVNAQGDGRQGKRVFTRP
jgi:hypothetical protein